PTKEDFSSWVEGYVRAWNSNQEEDIAQLFSEDALYYTGPFDEPWHGHDSIIQGWLGRKDEPGNFAFQYD
ncbi:MAG: hypothetical protein GTO63_06920, partial [Anaerolineae bacterium]|nr:hypothetical protein [Anaerolineae bacterium]NIN93942.1 hypothetical protein [Anaerolineae bacterium]